MARRTVTVFGLSALLVLLGLPASAEPPSEAGSAEENGVPVSTATATSAKSETTSPGAGGFLATRPADADDVLYAMGYVLAQKWSGLDLSPEELAVIERGLRDGLLGQESESELEESAEEPSTSASERDGSGAPIATGRTLYRMGHATAQNMAGIGVTTEELSIMKRGLRDGALGQEPEIEVERYSPRMYEFVRARLHGHIAEERGESTAFLEEMASREGAETFDSGLVLFRTERGSGASPDPSDRVTVHYHGTLRDGTVFDSSRRRGDPATFPLDGVFPCWAEALQEMREGGEATIVCPPDLAYGSGGAGTKIPPGAALQLEVELIEVHEESGGDSDGAGRNETGDESDGGDAGLGA